MLAHDIHQEAPVDPLTNVLGLLGLRTAQFARLEAGEPWAIGFSGYRHIKFGAVLQGVCRISVSGCPAVTLTEGDCYLVGSGRPYTLGGAREAPTTPSAQVFAGYVEGAPVRFGTGLDTVVVGCGFELNEADAAVLLDVLPPLVHVDAESAVAPTVHNILEVLRSETATIGLGSQFVTERLAHVLLAQVLRSYISETDTEGGGWLTAFRDRRIGAALRAMHSLPEHRWSVAELATHAGLSRSQFAGRFTACVGVPPMEYLAAWRLRSAALALRTGNLTIAAIASRWGYSSESSFSHAFKRSTGVSPKHYRMQHRGEAC
ncbi:AraC family transcriptional regulator [Streptomyces sp. NPDC086077]|uniref:AraC family transcriptional regulator n=1 Tax=Streptomyces sp. NPDC086077 TaxID=3154862 RepID=UPI00344897F7